MKNKKLLKAIAAITMSIAAAGTMSLFGCKHSHDFSGDWKTDSEYHWKECEKDGEKDREKDQSAKHVYTDDTDETCNECGYKRTIKKPDPTPVEHKHTPSDWKNDTANDKHYKECTSSDCDNPGVKLEEGTHSWTDGENNKEVCSVCGATRDKVVTPPGDTVALKEIKVDADMLAETTFGVNAPASWDADGVIKLYSATGVDSEGNPKDTVWTYDGSSGTAVKDSAGETIKTTSGRLKPNGAAPYIIVDLKGFTGSGKITLSCVPAGGSARSLTFAENKEGAEGYTTPSYEDSKTKLYITQDVEGGKEYKISFSNGFNFYGIIIEPGSGSSEDTTLADAKTAAKATLASYKDATKYTTNAADLEAAITAGNTAIDAATTTAEVDSALEAAKNALDAIKSDATLEAEAAAAALKKAKDDAKAELAKYNAGDYTANKAAYDKAIEDGNKAIEDATSTEAVTTALNEAKAVLDDIMTDKEVQEAALEAKKDAAKEDLEAYKDQITEDMSAEAKEAIEKAIADGIAEIDKATTEADVLAKRNEAEIAIKAEINKNLSIDKVKDNAAAALTKYAAEAKKGYDETDDAKLLADIDAVVAEYVGENKDGSFYAEDVTKENLPNLEKAAKDAIAALITADELAKAKVAATAAIEAQAKVLKDAYDELTEPENADDKDTVPQKSVVDSFLGIIPEGSEKRSFVAKVDSIAGEAIASITDDVDTKEKLDKGLAETLAELSLLKAKMDKIVDAYDYVIEAAATNKMDLENNFAQFPAKVNAIVDAKDADAVNAAYEALTAYVDEVVSNYNPAPAVTYNMEEVGANFVVGFTAVKQTKNVTVGRFTVAKDAEIDGAGAGMALETGNIKTQVQQSLIFTLNGKDGKNSISFDAQGGSTGNTSKVVLYVKDGDTWKAVENASWEVLDGNANRKSISVGYNVTGDNAVVMNLPAGTYALGVDKDNNKTIRFGNVVIKENLAKSEAEDLTVITDKVDYLVDDTIDESIVVVLNYKDGIQKYVLTSGYTVDKNAVTMSASGSYTVTVTATVDGDSVEGSYTVNVYAPQSIALSGSYETEYMTNAEEIDTTNMKVTVTAKLGEQSKDFAVSADDCDISVDNFNVGSHTVTVAYGEVSTTFTINVTEFNANAPTKDTIVVDASTTALTSTKGLATFTPESAISAPVEKAVTSSDNKSFTHAIQIPSNEKKWTIVAGEKAVVIKMYIFVGDNSASCKKETVTWSDSEGSHSIETSTAATAHLVTIKLNAGATATLNGVKSRRIWIAGVELETTTDTFAPPAAASYLADINSNEVDVSKFNG